jgi:hypothetical protein
MSQSPPSNLNIVTADWCEDEFLNIADNYATVVEPDADAGVEGFVSFGFEEFLSYSIAIVSVTRARNRLLESDQQINNHIDFAIGKAILAVLSSNLSEQYGFVEADWPSENEYVAMYNALYATVRTYEIRKMPIQLRSQAIDQMNNLDTETISGQPT